MSRVAGQAPTRRVFLRDSAIGGVLGAFGVLPLGWSYIIVMGLCCGRNPGLSGAFFPLIAGTEVVMAGLLTGMVGGWAATLTAPMDRARAP